MRPSRITFSPTFIFLAIISSIAGVIQAQKEPKIPTGPPKIIGLPVNVADKIPGIDELFDLPNASQAPEIVDGADFLPGEIIVRLLLDVDDNEVRSLVSQAGRMDFTLATVPRSRRLWSRLLLLYHFP